MKPALWRTLALACLSVALAFVLYQMTLPDREDFGLTFTVPFSAPGKVRVQSVEPNSPAAAADIRKGDLIEYGSTVTARANALYATAGSHVPVTVNGTRRVVLTARYIPQKQLPWAALAIRLAFLLVAALLAWRRPDDPATRALVVFLGCYGLAIAMPNGVLPTPLLSLLVLQFLYLILFISGTAAAAVFAATFPSGTARPLPRALSRTSIGLALLASFGIAVSEWVPRSARTISVFNAVFILTFVVIGFLVVATLVVAYVQGAPSERQRRRWVFLILGIGLSGPLLDVIVQSIFGFNVLVDTLSLLPLGLIPIGLAYVILRHRVIDVGFVLNRAIVYAGVSAVIVAVFVIVETLLSKYVEQSSHVESVSVQLAVALVLGFSVRAIHSRVDRFVDSVLFRERHLAEAAIRYFAHDAPYITDAGVLLSRCVKTVERYTHARGAGVWTAQSPTYRAAAATFPEPAVVDENDPALVAMRARRVNVDLREAQSGLPGAVGFPMIVRGELLGVLVCGPKTDDEVYAPDERDALASLAVSVGHALDGIQVRELRRRLEELDKPSTRV